MKTITLKTTVGGQFDIAQVGRALHEHGPFEPDTEYTIQIDVKSAVTPVPVGTPEPVREDSPRPQAQTRRSSRAAESET